MPAPPKPRSNVQRILGDMLTFEYIPLKDRAARAKANLLAAGKGTGKAMLGAIGAPADLIQLGSDAGSWLTGSTPQALPGADYMPTTEHLTSWADQALGGNSFLTRAPQNPGEAQATANTEALGMFNPLTDFKMAAAAGAIIPAAKKAAEEGVEKLGRIATGEPAKIRALHASPYDFDRFDITKIGTGEAGHAPYSDLNVRSGSGAKGAGLYFAENPTVSGPMGHYDRQFTSRNLMKQDMNQAEERTLRMLREGKSDLDILREHADMGMDYDSAENLLWKMKATKANLYEVDLNARPEDFLDQDAPLAGQPAWEKVRQYWDQHVGDPDIMMEQAGLTPQSLGSDYMQMGLSKEAAAARAEELRKAGVPGSKFFDQGSRRPGWSSLKPADLDARIASLEQDIASGGGDQAKMRGQLANLQAERENYKPQTRNYVVVDDSIISIVKKYGIAGALTAGAISQMQADQLTEQGYH